MDFIHDRKHLNAGDSVVVQCSHQCNILVMDDNNFARYKSRQDLQHHGGFFNRFPARIVVPSSGYWNVVIDLGGGSAQIKYNIGYMR
jgi:hypothetical protein